LLEREDGRSQLPPGESLPAQKPRAEDNMAPERRSRKRAYGQPRRADWNDYSSGSATTMKATAAGRRSIRSTLREHLLNQLIVSPLSERDRTLVAALIDDLDEDGYLTQPLDDITRLWRRTRGARAEEVETALKHLQNMDPTGVGARNLSECLVLQLRACPPTFPAR
jgi:RNA polymerase sigma-54 factor